jgi:hypothetical protein
MSGPVGVGGFEEGESEGDSPTEKVAELARSDEATGSIWYLAAKKRRSR